MGNCKFARQRVGTGAILHGFIKNRPPDMQSRSIPSGGMLLLFCFSLFRLFVFDGVLGQCADVLHLDMLGQSQRQDHRDHEHARDEQILPRAGRIDGGACKG